MTYIEINSEKRFGRPIIKGTRVAVSDIINWLDNGMTTEEIIADFPEITEDMIKDCISLKQSNMQHQFNILKTVRSLILKNIDGLSIEQLNKIPEGFRNNIAWNVAHLLVTQQLLCYRLSELPCLIYDEIIDLYKKGTAPTQDISLEDFSAIKKQLTKLPEQFEVDYNTGKFKTYKPYTTSTDITLNNIEEALAYNNFHEGAHLGVILSMKKLVS